MKCASCDVYIEPTYMPCPQCKSVNDDTAQFCDQCGTAMRPASHVSNMAGVEDMNQGCSCGHWNSTDAKFCGQCGQNLTGEGGSGYLWWKDGPSDPNVRVLKLEPVTAELWDGPSNSLVAAYESAKAKITGEKPLLGENRKKTVAMG